MNVAVIGGAGRMGRWLVRYFVSQGHGVVISDVNLDEAGAFAEEAGVELAKNNVEAVKTAELTMVSTPIQVTPEVVNEISTHAMKGAILAEISSLKSHVVKTLARLAEDVKPLSIHPLFGPGAKRLKGRKIAVIPILDAEAETELAREFFPGAEMVVVDAEEHDRAMALTLSLPYFMNIVFASVVSDDDLAALKRLEGPTFRLQLTLTESIMTEDPTLQASIQMNNKYALQYLNKFLSKAKTIEKSIANKDAETFASLCKNVQSLLSKDKDFAKAYEKVYRILEILQ